MLQHLSGKWKIGLTHFWSMPNHSSSESTLIYECILDAWFKKWNIGIFLMGYPIWFRVLRPKNRVLLVFAEYLLLHLSALLLLHLQFVDEHLEAVGGEHCVVVHLDQPSRLPDRV